MTHDIVFDKHSKYLKLDMQVSLCIAFNGNIERSIYTSSALVKSAVPLHIPHSGKLCVCGSCWFKIKTRCSALASPWWIFSLNSHTATLVTVTRSCKSQAHGLLFCEITRERAPVSYRLRFSCILFILCPCNLCNLFFFILLNVITIILLCI